MEDTVKNIAPAANADPAAIVDPIVSGPAAVAVPAALPEVLTTKPKGKPGRPRKLAISAAVPATASKTKRAPKVVIAADRALEFTAASAPEQAKPAARKPAKSAPPKTTPAKPTDVVVKARKTSTALSRSAAPKQKDTFIMTATTTEMTETIQNAMKDAADKAKAALAKSQAALGDMGTFTKGNMEAVMESSKILATGLQEMGKSYVAETKSVVETMTAEIKSLASVKSPTEFFEKQNAMMRKQFDAAVAVSSKNSEAMVKLASEAFQPISNRVSLAVEKIKQAA